LENNFDQNIQKGQDPKAAAAGKQTITQLQDGVDTTNVMKATNMINKSIAAKRGQTLSPFKPPAAAPGSFLAGQPTATSRPRCSPLKMAVPATTTDPIIQRMSQSDPTLARTLVDALTRISQGNLSSAGFAQFENNVAVLQHCGQIADDAALLNAALQPQQGQQALSASDLEALQHVISCDAVGANNTFVSTYNPADDAALQNLYKTGHTQLHRTLTQAWGDVQKGRLSAGAYYQFENTAIPLTTAATYTPDVPFSNDTTLAKAALNAIRSKISAQDIATLQNLIGSGSTGRCKGRSVRAVFS
jgi:hypothetical protein